MNTLGEDASPPHRAPAPQDHVLLWVVLMLGVLVASIWWLLNQPWAGGSSGVMERTVVIAPVAPEVVPAEVVAPVAGDAVAPPITLPEAATAPTDTAAASRTGKTDSPRSARKPLAARKPVAARQAVRKSAHLTRNARPLAGNAAPKYPLRALRAGIEGTVLVRVEIDSHGVPNQVSLEHRSGNRDLDRAALSAVRGWRFEPALRNGKAEASALQVPVDFVLD